MFNNNTPSPNTSRRHWSGVALIPKLKTNTRDNKKKIIIKYVE